MSVKLYKVHNWPLTNLSSMAKASRVFSSVQVRAPLALVAHVRVHAQCVVVDATTTTTTMHHDASAMVDRKKARAELRKGRRAFKKSEDSELASTPYRRTIASKAQHYMMEKVLASRCGIFLQCCAKLGHYDERRHQSRPSSLCCQSNVEKILLTPILVCRSGCRIYLAYPRVDRRRPPCSYCRLKLPPGTSRNVADKYWTFPVRGPRGEGRNSSSDRMCWGKHWCSFLHRSQ